MVSGSRRKGNPLRLEEPSVPLARDGGQHFADLFRSCLRRIGRKNPLSRADSKSLGAFKGLLHGRDEGSGLRIGHDEARIADDFSEHRQG